jgi:hypothetical protein
MIAAVAIISAVAPPRKDSATTIGSTWDDDQVFGIEPHRSALIRRHGPCREALETRSTTRKSAVVRIPDDDRRQHHACAGIGVGCGDDAVAPRRAPASRHRQTAQLKMKRFTA